MILRKINLVVAATNNSSYLTPPYIMSYKLAASRFKQIVVIFATNTGIVMQNAVNIIYQYNIK